MTGSSENMARTVGRRIADARRAAGLTQAELADRLNWPRDTLIHYEHGRRALALDRLAAIAAALNLHPAALLVEDDTLARLIGRLSADKQLGKQVAFFFDTLDQE